MGRETDHGREQPLLRFTDPGISTLGRLEGSREIAGLQVLPRDFLIDPGSYQQPVDGGVTRCEESLDFPRAFQRVLEFSQLLLRVATGRFPPYLSEPARLNGKEPRALEEGDGFSIVASELESRGLKSHLSLRRPEHVPGLANLLGSIAGRAVCLRAFDVGSDA
jgi:hypothetical protein